ncbi:MAG TPA: DUF4080 domain-containing protein [Spirochaetota bacterium]|nr:DUF4080 domain-containing protein [Spirochaetota bacterium]
MNKVLLLALNARYVHSNPALLYLQKYIAPACGDTVILERGINEKNSAILADIMAAQPAVIAISVYIWNTVKVKQLIPELRKSLPGTIIVLGGPDAGYNAGDWMASVYAPDYIVAGAGEAGMLKLAESGFSLKEKVIREKNPPFSLIPFPYNKSDMERLTGRFIYYESSRGCPYRCSYCLSSREDQGLEFRPVSMVCDELDFITSFSPGLVKFVDRTFNSRKEHYRPVWEHIVKNCCSGKTTFHFEIYPGLLDEDDLDFLSKVPPGLFQFEIGIQSVHSATLKAIHRVMDRKSYDIIERLISNNNIHIHLDLIAGLPFEDYTGFANSFNRILGLNPHHFQPGILKVLPGTEMMERSAEYGLAWSPDPPYAVKSTKWLNAAEMERIVRIAELVEAVHNSGRFNETGRCLAAHYGGCFTFYEKLAMQDTRGGTGRNWNDLAVLIISLAHAESPEILPLIMDCLRWDWCASGKLHHYPDALKSQLTADAKRKGYNYFIRQSERNRITAGGVSFSKDELRHSIFFVPETAEFREKMMSAGPALFLPDKRVIFFDLTDFIK